MEFVDLTMPINELTPTLPGDPKLEFKRVAYYEKDGWNEHRFCMNTHFGTHIDSPWHMIENGKRLTDFSITKFIGRAFLLDARKQENIYVELGDIEENMIVLLRTDYTKLSTSPDFFRKNPVVTRRFADELIRKKVSILGIDSFTPDNSPYEIHKLLFKNDILILENLVNLDKITTATFAIFIFPLLLEKTDGAPCRVVAQIG